MKSRMMDLVNRRRRTGQNLTCEEYVEVAAEFLGVPGKSFHVFDLTECDGIVLTMSEQYDSGFRPVFAAPPPQGISVLVTCGACIILRREGEAVAVSMIEDEYLRSAVGEIEMRKSYLKGRMDENPELASYLRAKPDFQDWFLHEGNTLKPEPLRCTVDGLVDLATPDAILAVVASCAFEAVAMPVTEVSESQGPRPIRRRLQREGVGVTWHKVGLTSRAVSRDEPHSPGDRRALHYCRGHWRASQSERARMVDGQMRIWIEGHWKGDPTKGIVLHTYTATERDAFLRRLASPMGVAA